MAKRTQYRRTITGSNGALLASVPVKAYEAGTTTLAKTYTGITGASSQTTARFTNSEGIVSFYLEPGSYDILIEDSTYKRITTRKLGWDSVSGNIEGGIAGSQLENKSVTRNKILPKSILSGRFATNSLSAANFNDKSLTPYTAQGIRSNTAQLPYAMVNGVVGGTFKVPASTGRPVEWVGATQQADTMWTTEERTNVRIKTPGVYLISAHFAPESEGAERVYVAPVVGGTFSEYFWLGKKATLGGKFRFQTAFPYYFSTGSGSWIELGVYNEKAEEISFSGFEELSMSAAFICGTM